MKKFTKGCLITALVLFIFGGAFWGICGIMGGFTQLEERGLRQNRVLSIGWNGIQIGYDGYGFRFWDWDWDWDDVVEDLADIDDLDDLSIEDRNLAERGDLIQTSYQASDITDIDIEFGGCNLVIKESDDEYVWVQNDSKVNTVKYGIKNGTFRLEYGKNIHVGRNVINNGTIYLYLPKDMMNLNAIDIELGAGNMESIALAANEIDIEASAGGITMDGLQGDEIDITVGAGSADIDKITARILSMESGAGGITVHEFDVTNLELEAGAGSIDVTGVIEGNADVECAAGGINMTLLGYEADYNYQLECAVGSIQIGSSEYSGLAKEKYIDHHAGKQMDIECSMGSVDIRFTEK